MVPPLLLIRNNTGGSSAVLAAYIPAKKQLASCQQHTLAHRHRSQHQPPKKEGQGKQTYRRLYKNVVGEDLGDEVGYGGFQISHDQFHEYSD